MSVIDQPWERARSAKAPPPAQHNTPLPTATPTPLSQMTSTLHLSRSATAHLVGHTRLLCCPHGIPRCHMSRDFISDVVLWSSPPPSWPQREEAIAMSDLCGSNDLTGGEGWTQARCCFAPLSHTRAGFSLAGRRHQHAGSLR